MLSGKHKPIYYIGNAFMALSFFCLVFMYAPVAAVYLGLNRPNDISNVPLGTFLLSIEKIGAQAPIYFDVDPWNEKEYKEILQKGIAHAKGSSKPGQEGTTYLFAHSSDLPWRITRYNTIFFKLNQLQTGDEIKISGSGVQYKYQVREKKIVSPRDISYLATSNDTQLILQTCWPIGTDWQRLLVFADPI